MFEKSLEDNFGRLEYFYYLSVALTIFSISHTLSLSLNIFSFLAFKMFVLDNRTLNDFFLFILNYNNFRGSKMCVFPAV